MAIESKVTLINDLERKLGKELTVTEMTVVLGALSDELQKYSLEYIGEESFNTDDMLDAYVNALSVSGRSPKTIEHYTYVIKRMYKILKVHTRSITVYHLRKYLADEKARGLADQTLEGIRQTFTAYFNWLQRERLIETNPTANLAGIKCQKKQKDIFSESDIELLKQNCTCDRDKAIVCFLLATGCRISEMTGLNIKDLDIANMECKVLGKGNKERIVFIDQVTTMMLRNYLMARKDNHEALFVGKGSNRLKPSSVRRMLVELGKKANVYHVHPHKFRRTKATNLIRHGMPIQEVAAILGHDKLDTTMQYIVLDVSDIKHSYKKYA